MGGGGGGSTPQPPAFQAINVGQVGDQALAADISGYNFSDADLASRFPGLVAGRNQQVTDAYNQLTGPLDPTVQSSFVNQGLEQSLGSFGGGNQTAGIGKDGTAAGNAVATSLANNVQNKQDYDRVNFESTLANNPQRAFGLNGEDVLNELMANTQGQNAYNQQKYLGQIGASNASSAAAGQQQSAAIGTGVSILTAIAIAY